MQTSTRCQRCGYTKKSDYNYEECPVCKAPMLFLPNIVEEKQK